MKKQYERSELIFLTLPFLEMYTQYPIHLNLIYSTCMFRFAHTLLSEEAKKKTLRMNGHTATDHKIRQS